ncbi:inositol monophosphatase family protein [Marinitenerispora sediminis]|uniref:Inositol-1-monophosphatase n=1 Tax=Marinitenerispora sediminis TaxID=1931232 RepID=A0A368T3E2_9ACTN|nr:inositol monophosphatase family protein [Marinitenerispora sediminis]RCV49474.1 inositol monophosphatase [Marinitenerispora sediminis]RCV57012.1 inositol monophosphatase [Marinitenerispora sediminis]RCV58639.1 inositol monophosphatase [Marinitenerispora sediminis]
MTAVEPRDLLDLAVAVAREAGALAAEGQEKVAVLDTKSSPTDVVTEMDRATEELIRSRLLAARPGDAVLGEEGGAATGSSGVRWIVDPIDGTVNYLYGRAEWAVSIAAEVAGEVVAGVVAAPARGELYTALRHGGAHRDGLPLRVAPAVPLELALVATGFGYGRPRRAQQSEVLRHVLPRVRDIRRAGAAALDLCALAAGQVDAYYERGLNPWDWSAAALVAEEAGARVGGLHGAPPNPELTIAAPPGLFEELHDLLAPTGADTDG